MATPGRGEGKRGSINEYKKALASRKGKSAKGLGKAAAFVATTAVNAIPAGRAASAVAKTVVKGKATKITSGASTTKSRTFTQGKNAKIKNTPPKKTGVGPNSPVKGTKTKVTWDTKKISPGQQAWQKYGMATVSKTRQGLAAAKAGSAGAYVAGNSASTAAKQKANKKKKK